MKKGLGKSTLWKSGAEGISDDTFNKGSAAAAAQFDQSRKAMERCARKHCDEGELAVALVGPDNGRRSGLVNQIAERVSTIPQ